MGRQRAMLQESRSWPVPQEIRARWTAHTEASSAVMNLSEQEFDKAEAAAQRAEQLYRRTAASPSASREERENALIAADSMLAFQARAKLNQGRLAEAEGDIRNALLSRIASGGKYQLPVSEHLFVLARLKFLRADYESSLYVNNHIFEILDALRVPKTTGRWVSNMNARAWALSRMSRQVEAEQAYRLVDDATESWPDHRKLRARTPPHRMAFMVSTGRSAEAIQNAEQALIRAQQAYGDDHGVTANMRVSFAAMLSRTGRIDQSLTELRKAIGVLFDNAAEEKDDIDSGGTAGLDQPVRYAVLNFLYAVSLQPERSQQDIDEGFRYAEAVRSDSVQRALLAASARAALQNPSLACWSGESRTPRSK